MLSMMNGIYGIDNCIAPSGLEMVGNMYVPGLQPGLVCDAPSALVLVRKRKLNRNWWS